MPDVTEGDQVRPSGLAAPQPDRATRGRPSRWHLFWVWLALGAQSFGGGMATLFLIRRAAVEQERWLSEEEFTRDWSLCFVTPGINLLSMTVLVGHRVAGWTGSLIALTGLLLPSVTITAVMAALYSRLQGFAAVQDALGGIIPATVGLGLLLAIRTARPLLAASRHEGRASLGVSLVLLAGSMGVTALWQLPVPLVLCGAGVLGALAMWWRAVRRQGRL